MAQAYEADVFDEQDEEVKARLHSAVQLELASAVGTGATGHAAMAQQLLAAYLGTTYPQDYETDGPNKGELKPGSKVVTRDVAEAVEAAHAQIMEMIHGSENPVEAEGIGEEDQTLADQQTAWMLQVYCKDNPGYRLTSDVVKTALISGEGIWKTTWRDVKKRKTETYTDINPIAAQLVAQEKGATVLSIVPSTEDGTIPRMVVRRIISEGRVKVEAVAPEEMRWPVAARSVEECHFLAHVYQLQRGDLRAMGFDRDVIAGLTAGKVFEGSDGSGLRHDTAGVTDMRGQSEWTEYVEVAECYIRGDFLDDGVPGWWQVWMSNDTCLHYEEVDEHPFSICSPIPMPFSVSGIGMAQSVEDVQRISTELTRQLIDRIRQSVQGRFKILENSPAFEALLSGDPDRPLVVRDMADVQRLDDPTDIAAQAQALQWFKSVAEARTGIGATSQGLNPDLLNNTAASTVAQVMTAAQRRVLLMARNIAECGLRPMFERILRLSARHGDKARRLALHGKAVEIDPRGWTQDLNLRVNVGLGTGDRSQLVAGLMALLQLQKEALANGVPFVKVENVYRTAKLLVRALGLPAPESLLTEPPPQEQLDAMMQQAPPDPSQDPGVVAMTQAEQIKAQATLEKARLEDDFKRDKLEADMTLEAAALGQKLDLEMLRRQMAAPRDPAGNVMMEQPLDVA